MNTILHKFGGSSVATAEKIKNVAKIISGKNESIVVSASGKTTSKLKQAIELAINSKDYSKILVDVLEHHKNLLEELIPNQKNIYTQIENDINNIKHILNTISITGFCADSLRHFILGYGEIWSAKILANYLSTLNINTIFVDASEVLIVDNTNYPVCVDWEQSTNNIHNFRKENQADVYVITGFIAQNKQQKRTILGMNCSDYSAAIFAKLINARKLYIWTDVAGVFSANPQMVPEAKPLKALTYKEALELAYFGASVVHPLTIGPMLSENTPIYIKSSYAPNEEGTKISNEIDVNQGLIKGLTSINDVAIVRVQGAGMIGVSGISAKVFSCLEKEKVSVMMISQASSEYSICFAIENQLATKAVEVLQKEFQQEINTGLVDEIVVEKNYSLVTAVGEGMKAKTGSLSKLLNSLKLSNINVHAIAQGSSERSVTFAVKEEDEKRAVQAMHRHYNSVGIDVAVAIIGAGNVGKAFVRQLRATHRYWFEKGVNIVLVGITNSKKMKLTYENLLFMSKDNILETAEDVNLSDLADFLSRASSSKKVIIDSTANEGVAKNYLEFLSKGINVITPNKHANTDNYGYYEQLRQTAKKTNTKFLYETNVCAGLPLISTLQNMVQSGDEVEAIKGIFSGTLSYLFSQLNNGIKFSDAVKMAYDNGYTEPDPRQDLSGMDVARKTVILAREIGLTISLSDLNIENLVPKELRECSIEEFFKELPKFDKQITKYLQEKTDGLAGVHYVGSVDTKTSKATVSVQNYDLSSPFVGVQGTDNIVMINTERYIKPLVIQGAGAGLDVTAGGIYADLLTIMRDK